MTPTEQDKELREKLVETILSILGITDRSSGNRPGQIATLEQEIVSYITADRKRVALEARLQEVEVSIIELERSDDPRFYSKDEAIRSQRARYTHLEAGLKAQQEEV